MGVTAMSSLLSSMLRSHTPPDAYSYPCLIKACTHLKCFSLGILLHQRVIVDGFSLDSYILTSLIDFYARFGRVANAQKLFDLMTVRDVIPWTIMIGCYARGRNPDRAFYMYNLMRFEGIRPSSVTLLTVLGRIAELWRLEFLHGNAIRLGLHSHLNLRNCMLTLYGNFGRVDAARDLFDSMAVRDIVSWNSLVSCYARNENFEELLCVLKTMSSKGFSPGKQTSGTVRNYSKTLQTDIGWGTMIYEEIVASGLEVNAYVAASLVVLYSEYGDISTAFKIFESVSEKNANLWTSMISAFVQNNGENRALMIFGQMLESKVTPTTDTFTSVIVACAKLVSLQLGTLVHGYLVQQRMTEDTRVQNSLITMYGKCGHTRQSYAIFSSMSKRDVVSWNAIVAAYAENGDLWNALCLLNEMRSGLRRPDAITVVSLLQACASSGAFQPGKWVHNFVIKTFTESNTMIDTALVDMYAKCGDLHRACKCFNKMLKHDVVSWSTMIAGYGSNGKGEMALKLYSDFLLTGIRPNHVLFLSILFSCSHNGFVSEGLSIFKSMIEEFGIKPGYDHCACIIDLLCCSGRIGEAYDLAKNMFSEYKVEVLGIVLDACREKGDAKVGEIVARDMMKLKPDSAGNYVQLANSYASMKSWERANDAWFQMKALVLKKLPGWSCIHKHDKITTFL